jgi:hypothetical protein
MPFDTLEEDLLFSINYAMQSFNHAPRFKKDRAAMISWKEWLARHVFEHLQRSGWEFTKKEIQYISPARAVPPKE